MTRVALVRRRLGAVFVALIVAVQVAGCAQPPRTPPVEQEMAELPPVRAPGTLYMPLFEQPRSLDPARRSLAVERDLLHNVMEGLVRIGADGTVEPALAERWDCEAGDTVCRFYLRRGARWSDGAEITADDFVYGWLRMLDPAQAAPRAGMLSVIAGATAFSGLGRDAPAADYETARQQVGIEAEDRYTLAVRLPVVPPYLLPMLADDAFLPQRRDVVERHGADYATAPDKMVFNGPFVVSEWAGGADLVLRPNAHYWDAGAVQLDEVVWMAVPDFRTGLAMFDAGEIDVIGVGELRKHHYANHPRLAESSRAETLVIELNPASAALQRHDVREALNLAVDRRVIAEQMLGGSVVPAVGLVPPAVAGVPGSSFREAAGAVIAGHGGQARMVWTPALAEDGLTGRKLIFVHDDDEEVQVEAEFWAAVLESVLPGLQITLSARGLHDPAVRDEPYDLLMRSVAASYDDAASFLNVFRSDNPSNEVGWRDPAFDVLLDQADRSVDPAERIALLAEAEALLLADLPVLPLYHPKTYIVWQPHVTGAIQVPVVGTLLLKEAQVQAAP